MAQGLPQTALLPWNVLGVDNEFTGRQRQWLDQTWQSLADAVLLDPQSYRVYANPPSLNSQKLAQRILVGNAAQAEWRQKAVVPLVCGLGEYLDIFLLLSDFGNDQLTGIVKVGPVAWTKPSDQMPTLPVANLLAELKRSANLTPKPYQQSALQLDIRSAKPWTRADRGDQRCLDIRLAQRTYQSWPTLTLVGREELSHIRQMVKFAPAKVLRPSRVLLTEWRRGESIEAPFILRATLSEGVFGQQLQGIGPTSGPASLDRDGWLSGPGVENVTQQLNDQAQSLQLKDLPKVAKVYGAWVYLDKGRAFGLKMNDRLVVAGQESEIKGHVVGFYGPNHKFVSPNGYPIQEGAIVYIRLGQAKTKVGQSLTFDQRQFPTPWPPGGDTP